MSVNDRRWVTDRKTGERRSTGYKGALPWQVRWRDAERKQRTETFERKADAVRFEASVRHQLNVGDYVDPDAGRMTLSDWLEEWRVAQHHRPSTTAQVEGNFRLHVYPAIGSRQLRSLKPMDMQQWVNRLSARLAPGTVEVIYRHVAHALKDAERNRLIARTPCDAIKLPARHSKEVTPPKPEQVQALIDAIDTRYRAAVVMGAGAGLRLGEVFGMTADHLDLEGRRYRVEYQLATPARGPAHLAAPKTRSSVRTVSLAPSVCRELADHLERTPPVDGFIFTTRLDAPVRRSTFQDAWRRARIEAGVGPVRFHDLRHFYASALIHEGLSVPVVQKALGHAKPTETLNTYSHLWPTDEDLTGAAIEALLAPHSCATDVQRCDSLEQVGRLYAA